MIQIKAPHAVLVGFREVNKNAFATEAQLALRNKALLAPTLEESRHEFSTQVVDCMACVSGFDKFVAALFLVISTECALPTAHAGPIFSGVVQLWERDLNGDGRIDAYFDSVFGVTWLRDWNYLHTRQPTIPGHVNWPTALSFADFAGSDPRFDPALGGRVGWRLPTMREFVSVFEALPHMQNAQEGYYWSADVYTPFPELTWSFQPLNVSAPSGALSEYTELLHVALVRDGDVSEPSSWLLVGVALLGAVAVHFGTRPGSPYRRTTKARPFSRIGFRYLTVVARN